jgi:hypothetical protein
MGNLKASSVAPLTALEGPANQPAFDQAPEQARDFHFAVTWVTLFDHLSLIESTGPRRRVESPAPTRALTPVVASPIVKQRAVEDSSAAWEMVVPKMIRTDSGTFTPAESSKEQS